MVTTISLRSKTKWKTKRQNYTFMALKRSIMAAKNLSQFLWGEILKTLAYLKNWSLEPNPKTPYKRLNHEKPDFSHLKVLEARAWVSVLKDVQIEKLAD